MPRFAPRVWLSSRRRHPAAGRRLRTAGLTLVELLVVLVILSILAAAALPYAEVTVRREKELELRQSLRQVRTALDAFHDDWKSGKIPKTGDAASDDGYPKSLQTLVDGVDTGQARGKTLRYLRRIPRDPFGDTSRTPAEQWVMRGYQDDPDTLIWNGKDVYDIRSSSDAEALDGSRYRDW